MAAKKRTTVADAGDFWSRVKGDLQRSLKEGVEAFREGATFVRKKAEHLSDEGKRQYRILDLKMQVRKEIAELGGRVYAKAIDGTVTLKDATANRLVKKISSLEAKIMRTEGVSPARPRRVKKSPKTTKQADA